MEEEKEWRVEVGPVWFFVWFPLRGTKKKL